MQGEPETWRGVGHVDLDAADEHQVTLAKVRVDDVEHLLLHDFVGLHRQLHHLLRGRGHLSAVRPQLLAQPALLQVLRVKGELLARGHLAERGDGSAARRRVFGLPRAQELPRLSVRREADVRAEEQHDVATVRHVRGEGAEARLAHAGRAADAAKEEAGAVVLREERGDVPLVAVDLVGADGVTIDHVVAPHAEGLGCSEDPEGHLGARHRAGEACLHRPAHVPLHGTQECGLGRHLHHAFHPRTPQPRGRPQHQGRHQEPRPGRRPAVATLPLALRHGQI
mmetsp:Transcript_80114/g.235636  ORF Transcript_80114/g.235636 Transcript_80114/m.235636 type:complete len:282 (-) Transcript_80114:47-892(-)